MIVTPLGWTSHSYQHQDRRLTKAHAQGRSRRPGAIARTPARVSAHRHSDMTTPLGWTGGSYGKGSDSARR